jgi:hypothetical protein
MADLPPALTQARHAMLTWRTCLQSTFRVRATNPPSLLRLHRQVPAHASFYLQPRDRDRSLTQSCPHRQSLSASLLALRALGCEEATRVGVFLVDLN